MRIKTKIIEEDDDTKITTLTCGVMAHTKDAVKIMGTKGEPVFLPRSQCKMNWNRLSPEGEIAEFEVPFWLILKEDIV